MADCGASGSALDQAARAMMGGASQNGQAAQKQFGKLLGHAAISGASMQHSMPATRPDQIQMPKSARHAGDALLSAMPSQQQQRPAAATANSQPHAAWQQHPAMAPRFHHPAHPTQHHHPMAMQQQHHHQMMMMQHQQQMHMAMVIQHQQQQQQQAMQNNKFKGKQAELNQESTQAAKATNNLGNWHEGLEEEVTQEVLGDEGIAKGASVEELAAAWAEATNDDHKDDLELPGHEGNVQGASMEELAAAWTEAQNEYYQQLDVEDQDPSNMWYTDADHAESHLLPYQFVNKMPETKNGEAGKSTVPPDTKFMEKGMQKFKEGNISEAIRNFEMELQLNDPDNATAWRLLGKCHAENDMDREAITCLEHAVDRDPYSPEALLALGVSYVNELNHTKALANLKQWITNNPKYAGMDLDIEDDVYGEGSAPASDSQSGFQEVQNLLLKALEFDSSDAADVWEALGVAANVSRDYETAVEAFHKAIQARSDDYQLYNKLGATLANSSQSDKALPAYFKALQLRPKYARAWLNMAISHSNLQDFDEAARCYLQTLSLNPAAAHCWSYLRVALSCSERWDLIPLAAAQDLNAFKEHFDFVLYN